MPPLIPTASWNGRRAFRRLPISLASTILPASVLMASSSATGRMPPSSSLSRRMRSLSPMMAATSSDTSPLQIAVRKGRRMLSRARSSASQTLRYS